MPIAVVGMCALNCSITDDDDDDDDENDDYMSNLPGTLTPLLFCYVGQKYPTT